MWNWAFNTGIGQFFNTTGIPTCFQTPEPDSFTFAVAGLAWRLRKRIVRSSQSV